MNCREMSKDELDLVILSHLEASRRCFEDEGDLIPVSIIGFMDTRYAELLTCFCMIWD